MQEWEEVALEGEIEGACLRLKFINIIKKTGHTANPKCSSNCRRSQCFIISATCKNVSTGSSNCDLLDFAGSDQTEETKIEVIIDDVKISSFRKGEEKKQEVQKVIMMLKTGGSICLQLLITRRP